MESWGKANLGVGAKIHLINSHLPYLISKLEEGQGLGIWSEQASVSSHSAFKAVVERYSGKSKICLD